MVKCSGTCAFPDVNDLLFGPIDERVDVGGAVEWNIDIQ